jgi:hypothetical protein
MVANVETSTPQKSWDHFRDRRYILERQVAPADLCLTLEKPKVLKKIHFLDRKGLFSQF